MTVQQPPGSRRPGSRASARSHNGYSGLLKLLLVAGGLLALAAYVGGRNSGDEDSAQSISEQATADAQAPSHELQATVPAAPAAQHGQSSPRSANVGEARFSISPDGRSLRIDGGVGRNFAIDLRKALEANPYLQHIDITSGGGYASSGLEAARLIRQYNLRMRVRSYCASMCVGLWAAAPQREMEPDAVIGLHRWDAHCDALPAPQRDECNYAVQFWTEHDKVYDSWLRDAGFNERLLDLQERTPSDDIAVLNALQLWENGVDFRVVDANGQNMGKEDVLRFLREKYGQR